MLMLLAVALLCGCQTTPTPVNDLPYKPGPQAQSVLQNKQLDIQLGDASYFRQADAQAVVDIVEQTRTDLTQAKLISASPKSWLILWHHPDSPVGRQLLAGTKRDYPMRGITYYKHHTIVLVGNPTPSSPSRWQQIIRHETVHAMMFDTYGQQAIYWPWWLSEGIATTFEVRPVNDKPTIFNPWRLPMCNYLYKTDQGMATKHLLSFNGHAVNQDTYSKNYARAWALTCYLANHQPQLLKDCMDGKHVLHSQDIHSDPLLWIKKTNPFNP
jgi:hypothetical protein